MTINDAASPYSYATELEVWGNDAGAGGSSAAQIKWLVTDHLGTSRMVIDQTGSSTIHQLHEVPRIRFKKSDVVSRNVDTHQAPSYSVIP